MECNEAKQMIKFVKLLFGHDESKFKKICKAIGKFDKTQDIKIFVSVSIFIFKLLSTDREMVYNIENYAYYDIPKLDDAQKTDIQMNINKKLDKYKLSGILQSTDYKLYGRPNFQNFINYHQQLADQNKKHDYKNMSYQACFNASYEIAKFLYLNEGFVVDKTTIYSTIAGGSGEIITFLENKGAKFDNCGVVCTMFHRIDVMKYLLEHYDVESISIETIDLTCSFEFNEMFEYAIFEVSSECFNTLCREPHIPYNVLRFIRTCIDITIDEETKKYVIRSPNIRLIDFLLEKLNATNDEFKKTLEYIKKFERLKQQTDSYLFIKLFHDKF